MTQNKELEKFKADLKIITKKYHDCKARFSSHESKGGTTITQEEKAELEEVGKKVSDAETRLYEKEQELELETQSKILAKLKNDAKELIKELNNVFVKGNLEATSYEKLQDYSMDITTISDRINATGVLNSKAQKIVEELSVWDNKIHEEIETKVAAIKSKEQAKVIKKKTKPSTKLKITANDYVWTPKITGQIEWGNESKQIDIKDLQTIPTCIIPWNTKGKLTLNLSLAFSLKEMPQKEYKQERTVYGEFSVDDKGKFELGALNQQSFSKTGLSIKSTIINFVLLKAKEIKSYFRKTENPPSLEETVDKVTDTLSNIVVPVELIQDQINKHSFNANISAIATGNSIRIETKYEISGTVINVSLSPLDVGVSFQFDIPDLNKTNSIATIKFEAEKNNSQTIEQSTKVQFNKEGDFTIDGDDKNTLKLWRSSVKNKLTATLVSSEQKKNTPKNEIEKKVRNQVRNILLGNKYSIEVIGFASSTKSRNKNNDLGYDRAQNIKKQLVKMGFKEDRILHDSDGEKTCKEKYGDNSDAKDCKFGSVVFSIDLE